MINHLKQDKASLPPLDSDIINIIIVKFSTINIIESSSAEGGHSAHRVCTNHYPTQALSP